MYKKEIVIEFGNKKIQAQQKNLNSDLSNLKSILNREKSPKVKPFKDDLKNLFNKNLKIDETENASLKIIQENNDMTTNSNMSKFPIYKMAALEMKTNSADLTIENNTLQGNYPTLKKSYLFKNKIKSRFTFAEVAIENKEDNICVPQKINEIISKKISTYFYMKSIGLNQDASEYYIKKNCDDNEWTDFMINIKKEIV